MAPFVAMAGWTSPQQQHHHQQTLSAEPSIQPPPTPTKRWDVLMIAIDDLRSELSCSGPQGFDSHAIHTPHLCDLAKDSLMLLRSQVCEAMVMESRVRALTPSRPHATGRMTITRHDTVR